MNYFPLFSRPIHLPEAPRDGNCSHNVSGMPTLMNLLCFNMNIVIWSQCCPNGQAYQDFLCAFTFTNALHGQYTYFRLICGNVPNYHGSQNPTTLFYSTLHSTARFHPVRLFPERGTITNPRFGLANRARSITVHPGLWRFSYLVLMFIYFSSYCA